MLVQENDTRWNSWLLCIRRITLLWPEIKECLQIHHAQHLMHDSDIVLYKEFSALLEPLYFSTLELEKENSTRNWSHPVDGSGRSVGMFSPHIPARSSHFEYPIT
jgi:hypothetical protein